MPEVDTELFTEDGMLSEFAGSVTDPAMPHHHDFPPLDLPYVEPSEVHVSPPPPPRVTVVAPPLADNPTAHHRPPLGGGAPKPCAKLAVPLIKPKLAEKPIQPNYVVEKNADKKITYIQKPGTNTVVPVQNVGQIHVPSDQIKQVVYRIRRSFRGFSNNFFYFRIHPHIDISEFKNN